MPASSRSREAQGTRPRVGKTFWPGREEAGDIGRGGTACAGAAEVIGYVTGASRLDWTPIKIHRYASKKETPMAWKTPKIVELPVGLEINMYACAARK